MELNWKKTKSIYSFYRFDVRGALYDLREAEAKGRPLEEVLTEAELKEEEICDQERYFALYYDEFQHQIAYGESQKLKKKRLQILKFIIYI